MTKAAELAKMGEVLTNSQIGGKRNMIINGGMNVFQRSTSATDLGASSGYFSADRFKIFSSTSGRVTMSQSSDTPNGFGNSLKIDVTTADTSIASDELFILSYAMEGQDAQMIKKGTSEAESLTMSFYAKANASADYVVEMYDADNTRNNTQAFTVTSSWQRFSFTFAPDTTGALDDDNALSFYPIQIWLHGGSNYSSGTFASNTWGSVTNANRYAGSRTSIFDSTDREFFITGVQMEAGDSCTEFQYESYERTLAKCQRYFYAVHQDYGPSSSNYSFMGSGIYYSSTNINAAVTFPVAMRAIPTATVNFGSTGNQGFISYTNGSLDYIGSSASINMPSIYGTFIQFGDGSGTGGHSGMVATQYDDQSFNFDAEL